MLGVIVRRRLRAGRTIAAALAALAIAAPSAAQQAAPSVEQIVAWVDQTLTRRVAAGEAPGAVVAVVFGGQLVHLKGYGFADAEGRTAMNPDATLMRVGGVSHLATAATALAQAEAGGLRLVQDVHAVWERAGISFAGPSTVTLQDMLTHTAGFGERLWGQFSPTEAEWESLAPYLARAMPPPVLRAGDAILPTAHGVALAGLTLELVAGQPFADLSRRLLFGPLGMGNSTFVARLDPPTLARMAAGLRWTGGGLVAEPYDFPRVAPAVGLVTTAADMARLLQAVLGGGAIPAGERLWSEEANQTLVTRRAANIGGQSGRSYALQEVPLGSRTVWISDGLTNGFTANVTLVPELGLGIFLAANGGAFRGLQELSPTGALVRGFGGELVAALWPVLPASVPQRNIAPDDRADYGGLYRVATLDTDTPLKVLRAFSAVHVEGQSDVRIVIDGEVFQKVGLDLFQSGPKFVRFLRDENRNVTHLLRPNEIFDRAPLFETYGVQRAVIVIATALFALGLASSLLNVARGRRGRLANAFGIVGAGGALVLIGWGAWQLSHLSLGLALVHGIPGVPFAAALWMASAVAGGISFFYALFGVGIPNFNRYTLIGTAIGWTAFYPVLRAWNLIG